MQHILIILYIYIFINGSTINTLLTSPNNKQRTGKCKVSSSTACMQSSKAARQLRVSVSKHVLNLLFWTTHVLPLQAYHLLILVPLEQHTQKGHLPARICLDLQKWRHINMTNWGTSPNAYIIFSELAAAFFRSCLLFGVLCNSRLLESNLIDSNHSLARPNSTKNRPFDNLKQSSSILKHVPAANNEHLLCINIIYIIIYIYICISVSDSSSSRRTMIPSTPLSCFGWSDPCQSARASADEKVLGTTLSVAFYSCIILGSLGWFTLIIIDLQYPFVVAGPTSLRYQDQRARNLQKEVGDSSIWRNIFSLPRAVVGTTFHMVAQKPETLKIPGLNTILGVDRVLT